MADTIQIKLNVDGKEAQSSLQNVNKDMTALQGSLAEMTGSLSGIMRELDSKLGNLSGNISILSLAINGMDSGADKSGSGLKEWGEGIENAGSMMSNLGTALTKTSPALSAFGGALSAIGPWGMAAGSALQLLGPVIDMIQDKSENAANNGVRKLNDQLKLMSLIGLNAEKDRLDKAIENAEKIKEAHKTELDWFQSSKRIIPDWVKEIENVSTSEGLTWNQYNKILDLIKGSYTEASTNLNKLEKERSEVLDKIANKEVAITAMLDDQKQSLLKQLEVESAGSASAKRLTQLKQEYEKRKELAEQLFAHQKISIQEKNNLLLQIERSYQSSVKDIRTQEFKAQENDLKIKYANAEAETNVQSKGDYSLQLLKKQHLDEMIALYKQYGKNVTELQKDLSNTKAAINKRTDINNVQAAPMTAVTPIPKELAPTREFGDPQAYADDWQKNWADREREELDMSEAAELKKADVYANAEEMKTAIHEKYSKYRNDIDKEEAQAQMDAAMGAMSFIGGAVGQNTVLGKAAAVANATMSTYEAAAKALTAGPIFGPILAGVITALGLANVSKILSIETPQMGGYAKGGIVVGEAGPEIIAPMQDYASGQALLVQQTVMEARRAMSSAQYTQANGGNQTLIQELQKLNASFEGYSSRPITITKDAVGKIVSQGNSQLRKSRV